MSFTPSISVIIPVYNVEDTIAKCLDSILEQSFKDFEIICVDDKSPDNSTSIIKEYISKYSNIKLVHHTENQGLGETRNTGISVANGKYVAFLDSDDTISSNFLDELFRLAEKNKSDVVMCNLEMNYGNKIQPRKIKEVCLTNFVDILNYLHNGSSCNKLWRLDFIKNYNLKFPKGVYFEDNLFVVKALYFSKKLCTTNKCSYYYFLNQSSITQNSNNIDRKLKSTSFLLNEIFKFAFEQNFSSIEIDTLKNFVLKSFVNRNFFDNQEFIDSLPDILKNDKGFFDKRQDVVYSNFFERIFSIKHSADNYHYVITVLFFVLKIRRAVK